MDALLYFHCGLLFHGVQNICNWCVFVILGAECSCLFQQAVSWTASSFVYGMCWSCAAGNAKPQILLWNVPSQSLRLQCSMMMVTSFFMQLLWVHDTSHLQQAYCAQPSNARKAC